MALIKLGVALAAASGSIGGTVFARNRGGAYIRNRTPPLQPQTPRQTLVRARMSDLARAWSDELTQTQRDAWENYASQVPIVNRIGEPRFVTGINMYTRANTLLLDTGVARVDDGPTVFTVGPTITPTITVDAANDTFDITNLGDFTPSAMNPINIMISASPSLQAARTFHKSPFTKVYGQAFTDTPALPVEDIPLAFPLAAGQRVFLRTASVTPDGRVGTPTTQSFLAS